MATIVSERPTERDVERRVSRAVSSRVENGCRESSTLSARHRRQYHDGEADRLLNALDSLDGSVRDIVTRDARSIAPAQNRRPRLARSSARPADATATRLPNRFAPSGRSSLAQGRRGTAAATARAASLCPSDGTGRRTRTDASARPARVFRRFVPVRFRRDRQ